MNKTRAEEIVSSPVMVEVTYNGVPIYIENVDVNNRTASIHFIESPGTKQQVSIDNLREEN